MTKLRRIAAILGCAAAVPACGSSHGHSQTQIKRAADPAGWSGLTRVSVDLDQPSVAPIPGEKNTPTTFTTPAQLRTVTKALNVFHIRKAAHTTTDYGCTGGIQIEIKITQHHHRRTDLSAYHCGKTISGNVAGNLTGFLNQIGLGTT